MKFVLFYHSFCSCWNHGNAHFLRGITRELLRLGHQVIVYEPENGWSRMNALMAGGEKALAETAALVPGVEIRTYADSGPDLDEALADADVVLVHEWTAPQLIEAIGHRRIGGGRFTLLFHDTHHRVISAESDIGNLNIEGFDGVLAFGDVLRELYVKRGWARRAFTWHEAADVELFRPIEGLHKDNDLAWIGNWGDGERTRELNRFLVRPVAKLGLRACVYGVRYPSTALRVLAQNGIRYAGWLPNHQTPLAFARSRLTVHVPRRPYVEALPGIPTIRVFEALACGIPLVCAPWRDAESLFPPGAYLRASTTGEMARAISNVLEDAGLAAELVRTGLATIRSRHTCAHRVFDLLGIVKRLRAPMEPAAQPTREADERVPAP
jgi:spore maturation protein CgeB